MLSRHDETSYFSSTTQNISPFLSSERPNSHKRAFSYNEDPKKAFSGFELTREETIYNLKKRREKEAQALNDLRSLIDEDANESSYTDDEVHKFTESIPNFLTRNSSPERNRSLNPFEKTVKEPEEEYVSTKAPLRLPTLSAFKTNVDTVCTEEQDICFKSYRGISNIKLEKNASGTDWTGTQEDSGKAFGIFPKRYGSIINLKKISKGDHQGELLKGSIMRTERLLREKSNSKERYKVGSMTSRTDDQVVGLNKHLNTVENSPVNAVYGTTLETSPNKLLSKPYIKKIVARNQNNEKKQPDVRIKKKEARRGNSNMETLSGKSKTGLSEIKKPNIVGLLEQDDFSEYADTDTIANQPDGTPKHREGLYDKKKKLKGTLEVREEVYDVPASMPKSPDMPAFPKFLERGIINFGGLAERTLETLKSDGDTRYNYTLRHINNLSPRNGEGKSELGNPGKNIGDTLKSKNSTEENLMKLTRKQTSLLHNKSARNTKVSYGVALKEALLAGAYRNFSMQGVQLENKKSLGDYRSVENEKVVYMESPLLSTGESTMEAAKSKRRLHERNQSWGTCNPITIKTASSTKVNFHLSDKAERTFRETSKEADKNRRKGGLKEVVESFSQGGLIDVKCLVASKQNIKPLKPERNVTKSDYYYQRRNIIKEKKEFVKKTKEGEGT